MTEASKVLQLPLSPDVQAMKEVLETLRETDAATLDRYDFHKALNSLVDGLLDIDMDRFEPAIKAILQLFTDVRAARIAHRDAEPFFTFEKDKLGEYVDLATWKKIIASNDLHLEINRHLIKAGVLPAHQVSPIQDMAFAVVRLSTIAKPEDEVPAKTPEEAQLRDIRRDMAILSDPSTLNGPFAGREELEREATEAAFPSAPAFEEESAYNAPSSDLAHRLATLENSVKHMLENEASAVEDRRIFQESILNEIRKISRSQD